MSRAMTSPTASNQSPTQAQTPTPRPRWRWTRWLLVALLALAGLAAVGYSAVSVYLGNRFVEQTSKHAQVTPASLGLRYRDVTFPARIDGLVLRGWIIPGLLPNGQLTTDRTIILVHPHEGNRAEPDVGILDISAALARNGFAVLAYDSRGHGDSPAAPFSAGLFEQRDVLGAVDYLRAGAIPYPELGRPRAIGALGISGGDAAALFAAAREPAIQAVVSDDGFATVMPIMEQLVRNENSLYMPFVPGALLADRLIYGIDFTQTRPVDVVARIAPRPVFFIHGAEDTYIPPSHFYQLSAAARAAPGAQVETWLEPKAHHARDYRAAPDEYTARVTAFFAKALGPDRTQA